SSRRRHTRFSRDWSSDVCSSDLSLVLDGTDNLATRRLTATTAEALGLTLVSGAVSMFDGQVTIFAPGGPRFTDLYPPEADDADQIGRASCRGRVGVGVVERMLEY